MAGILVSVIMITYFVVNLSVLLYENEMEKRNPTPRMINDDKRFSEIKKKYNHEMFS